VNIVTHIGVIFGGKSYEHQISIRSARYVFQSVGQRHSSGNLLLHPFYIDQEGLWRSQTYASNVIISNQNALDHEEKKPFPFSYSMIDCWFPLVHGQFGEDGQLQKQLEQTELPYIGSDAQTSLRCYDKIRSRQVAKSMGIHQPQYLFFKSAGNQTNEDLKEAIIREIKFPFFVKPAKTGSSIGISRVKNEEEIIAALELAQSYDHNILVEEAVENCLEIEIAFIGSKKIRLSIPGTVDYEDEFYTTMAKYSTHTTQNRALKNSNEPLKTQLNKQTAKIINCFNVKDMGRVDFFYDQKHDILYWNEINTVPGMTKKSMFPFLWKAQGLGIESIIDKNVREKLY